MTCPLDETAVLQMLRHWREPCPHPAAHRSRLGVRVRRPDRVDCRRLVLLAVSAFGSDARAVVDLHGKSLRLRDRIGDPLRASQTADPLDAVLGEYIEGFNQRQLELDVLNGHLLLQNLTVRSSALQRLEEERLTQLSSKAKQYLAVMKENR